MSRIGEARAVNLMEAVWPARGATAARAAVLVVLGSLLLWASAKVQVPFWPVPMTMQTFAVLVIGAAYGWKLGGATVLLYLAEGAVGLPVFAGTPERGIGVGYMLGPTGGYLFGFFAAAVVVGWLAERGWDRTIGRAFLLMLLGHAVIFVPGVLWLATATGIQAAFSVGFAQFWLATLLKTALATAVLPLCWTGVRRASE